MLYDLIYHARAFAVTDDIEYKLRKIEGGGKSLFEAAKDMSISVSIPFETMVEDSKNLIRNRKISMELDSNAEMFVQ